MDTMALTVMKHKRLISIVVMTVFIVISTMSMVFGAHGSQGSVDDLKEKLETIASTVRGFGAVICIVCAVYIGIMFILSSVNPKLRDQAKGALWGVLIGVIILVLADQVAGVIAGLIGEKTTAIE